MNRAVGRRPNKVKNITSTPSSSQFETTPTTSKLETIKIDVPQQRHETIPFLQVYAAPVLDQWDKIQNTPLTEVLPMMKQSKLKEKKRNTRQKRVTQKSPQD